MDLLNELPSSNFKQGTIYRKEVDNYSVIIYELNENAMISICIDNYEKALKYLVRAQQMLEQLCLGNYSQNSSIALLTFHNLALCSQK